MAELSLKDIGRREALALLAEAELETLLREASELRDRHKGRHLTYSPKVFLPVTNLCRDKCSYCTFRKSAKDPAAKTMSLAEIAAQSRQGLALGCKEALMCLGDRPEAVYPSYRELLRRVGVETTAEYVELACREALREGLLPHTNAGLLTRAELIRLRPYNVSMGLMLENISPRLREKGQAHAAAPDKDPVLRLEMIENAGALKIPFTTGVLVGIGETAEELVDSILAIRDLQARWGHIQEVIVQTFRTKPDVPMRDHPEMSDVELVRIIALARLLMPEMNLQAPPNLTPQGHRLMIRAGINDWGGISPLTKDFINPEAPWPHLDALAATCREEGFTLGERLPIYDEYLRDEEWLDPSLRPAVESARQRIPSLC
jgi:FO synthase